MMAVVARHSANNRRKLNVEHSCRGRVEKDQHFLSPAGGLGRKVTLVQDLLETRGIILAVLEAAQITVQLDPIVQNSGPNRPTLAHESLLNKAVRTSNAKPNRCKCLFILHAV